MLVLKAMLCHCVHAWVFSALRRMARKEEFSPTAVLVVIIPTSLKQISYNTRYRYAQQLSPCPQSCVQRSPVDAYTSHRSEGSENSQPWIKSMRPKKAFSLKLIFLEPFVKLMRSWLMQWLTPLNIMSSVSSKLLQMPTPFLLVPPSILL